MDGVQNANSLLTRLESVATHADKTVLGQSGLVPQATALVNETTATVAQARGTLTQVGGALAQLSGTLTQVSGSLTRVDGILKDVKGVSASANEASVDLVALRCVARLIKVCARSTRYWPVCRENGHSNPPNHPYSCHETNSPNCGLLFYGCACTMAHGDRERRAGDELVRVQRGGYQASVADRYV